MINRRKRLLFQSGCFCESFSADPYPPTIGRRASSTGRSVSTGLADSFFPLSPDWGASASKATCPDRVQARSALISRHNTARSRRSRLRKQLSSVQPRVAAIQTDGLLAVCRVLFRLSHVDDIAAGRASYQVMHRECQWCGEAASEGSGRWQRGREDRGVLARDS